MQFIDLKSQYQAIEAQINQRIQRVLEHGQFIMGPEVSELEKQLADFVGVDHCLSCANGTDALQIALMALDIGPGDAVFTTPFTFFATAEVIALVGARPVFVDVDPESYNISPQQLELAIRKCQKEGSFNPTAVISVDLFGQPADYPQIEPICKQHGLKLIEDAAQGLGGRIGERISGSFGDIATTSFFPAKPLGCYGDGGAIFTHDACLAEKIRSIRIHGKGQDKYDNVRIGLNSRLDTIQAAILLEKLAHFEAEISQRQRVADRYTEALKETYSTPTIAPDMQSVWAQYTLRSSNRDQTIERLKAASIPAMIYYPKPLHLLGAFSQLGYSKGDFPIAEKLSKTVFSLPMHPYLHLKEQQEVIDCLLA
ncbi:DegT/DnrJ/EryC1/StrS aminotransferase family protein [Motiliproteus coralliicola]|uniref:DegT/DnrJ/EryC1/StrS aminotransferase family protein n=1 Tax=Motiliproteus coralliicola TaxID=2283196 RepID=A0A369WRQ9_9GAMM|nr:DegT/DnrJ/EryC1/StrS aminotransferase family protein [Motiliproteus coralliicola]RDE24808.1 DegT/DnrJ/EryC1/StrS aminotransferase family protein [Motiliproteus coralliicola]